MLNRSAPHARIVPVLIVRDVREAVAWYAKAFGFVEHVRIGEGHRAQLGYPGESVAELIVAEVRPGRRVPTGDRSHQIMMKVDDVHAVLERAGLEAKVTDWEYGERQADVIDPFGHQWVLTQTLADIDPKAWGGETVVHRKRGQAR